MFFFLGEEIVLYLANHKQVLLMVTMDILFRLSGFIFFKLSNQKQELPMAAMFLNELGRDEQYLSRTFQRRFLPSFGSFGHAVSKEKIFKEIDKPETRIVYDDHAC